MKPEELSQQLKHLSSAIVDRVLVMKVANLGLAIIRERTISGKFLEGSSPGAEEYSTKPFGRPVAGIGKGLLGTLRKSEGVQFYMKNGKQVWVVIKGGYRAYREAAGKDISKVSMTWSGRMLRNLGVIAAEENSATLGEKDEDMKQLSLYHNVMGAGKSRRKHVFMGFTKEEGDRLAKLAGEEIMKRLKLV